MEESQPTSVDSDKAEITVPAPSGGNLESPPAEGAPVPCRPWGQWATIGCTVLVLVALSGAQVIALFLLNALGISKNANLGSIDASMDGNFLAASTLLGTLTTVGLVAFLIRARGCSVRDYLALRWPPVGSVFYCLAGMVVLLVAFDLTTYLSGRAVVPPVIVGLYNTAWLPGLIFAFIVLAPIGEETIFRGFLYHGIAQSRGGPIAAIIVSAALWALLHGQYDLFGIATIAVAGFYLGAVRWRTGSLFLTMVLHALQNAVGTAELLIQEIWLK